MKKLIFSNEKNESIIIEIEDRFRFVWDLTGKIDLDFINSNYETREFEKLYAKLREIDLEEYCNFSIEMDGEKISSDVKIKDILYRLVDYSYGGEKYEIRELLTFKFLPQNEYELSDDGVVYCKKECKFHKPLFCTKFNSYLRQLENKDTVCKMCFLEISSPIQRKLRSMHYNQIFPK